jgi:signal transduction histidine kinase
MGSHGVTHGTSRTDAVGNSEPRSVASAAPGLPTRAPGLRLRNWPVSWRLIAVIVLALGMGVTFGGLRIAAATGSAAQFARVTQLARLGQGVTGLVQSLEDERDETTGLIPIAMPHAATVTLRPWYNRTDLAAAKVRTLAAGIGGSFPSNIQARVAAVRTAIGGLTQLRSMAQASQSALAVIADYSGPVGDLLNLNAQIAQGTADATLVSSVQTLSSLALAEDEATQQRALLYNAFTQQLFAEDELSALATAESEQASDLVAFDTTATAADQQLYRATVTGPAVNKALDIEEYVLSVSSLNTRALNLSPTAAPAQWYAAMSGTATRIGAVEQQVASSVVARSQVLQRGAERSAVFTAVLTGVILLLVLIATLAVARSLVLPLRRLRAGALDIATVHLPERVRQIGETMDPAASREVEPIDVISADEIGQVARAFDLVHAEAVRLAGNEAILRGSFNAMFINLSRRSQSLIERLARTIDSLEQNEEDPSRLASLFTMDHLVTRMRRNAENLLLLSGHENQRKWNESILISDVARAAASEIEQYDRVKLHIQPGIAVSGPAVTDVAHLLAELIENATVYSPGDTEVLVSAQDLPSGGVLVEISDDGVGASEARLAQLNLRLDNPPEIDPTVARHMGLFAVARLAERHGIRVRLRTRSPRGLAAMVWLPDGVLERTASSYGGWQQPAPPAGYLDYRQPAGYPAAALPAAALPVAVMSGAPVPEPGRAFQPPASAWFRAQQPSGAGTGPSPLLTNAGPGLGNAGLGTDSGGWSVPVGWGQDPRAAQPQPSQPQAFASQPQSFASQPQAFASQAQPLAAAQAPPFAGQAQAFGRQAQPFADQAPPLAGTDPAQGERTAAGLPVRVPRANLMPGSFRDRPEERDMGGSPAETQPQAPAGLPLRSPERSRSRLSGFQRGTQRALGQTSSTTEGADH